MDVFIDLLFFLSLVIVFFFCFFVVPDRVRDPFNNLLLGFLVMFFEAVQACINTTKVLTVIIYFFGRVATLVVFSVAIFFAVNEALILFEFSFAVQSEIYRKSLILLSKPYAWAALAAIVASTSAINQILKYELEFELYMETQKAKWEAGIK